MMKSWMFVLLLLSCWLRPMAAHAQANANNPFFQAVLAGLLETTKAPSEAEKIKRFDEILLLSQKTFHPHATLTYVPDFETYLQLRNLRFSSSAKAFEYFKEHAAVTPLNIRTKDPELQERIIEFELQELSKNPFIADKSTKQGAMLTQFTGIFLQAISARKALDDKSAKLIDDSFKKADEFQKQRNPLGFLAFAVGTGLSVARSIGQNFVNPVTTQVLYGENFQQMARTKIAQQLSEISLWSTQKKLDVLQDFQRTEEAALADKFQQITSAKPGNISLKLPENIQALQRDLTGVYFRHLSSSQKAELVWTVVNDLRFAFRPPTEQMQIALGAIGPVLPFLMNQLSKLPPVSKFEAGPFRSSSKSWVHELEARISSQGYVLERLNATPVAISAFKETYLVEVKRGSLREKWVVQTHKDQAEARFKDDVRLLAELTAPALRQKWADAGFSNVDELRQLFMDFAESDLKFVEASEKQRTSEETFNQVVQKNIAGRPLTVEIKIPKTLPVDGQGRDFLIQEYVEGATIQELRKTDPQLAQLAISTFAEAFFKHAFSKSAVIWSEPNERNLRFQISSDRSRLQVILLNIEKSEALSPQQLKSFYANLARLPLLELRALSKARGADPAEALKGLEALTRSGFQLNATVVRYATGLLHLRDLVGPGQFKALLIKGVIANPSVVWGVLGAKLRQELARIYASVLGTSKPLSDRKQAQTPNNSKASLLCEGVIGP